VPKTTVFEHLARRQPPHLASAVFGLIAATRIGGDVDFPA
jgi:hypothetical protein